MYDHPTDDRPLFYVALTGKSFAEFGAWFNPTVFGVARLWRQVFNLPGPQPASWETCRHSCYPALNHAEFSDHPAKKWTGPFFSLVYEAFRVAVIGPPLTAGDRGPRWCIQPRSRGLRKLRLKPVMCHRLKPLHQKAP